MTHVIEDSHYEETRRALKADPIIQAMVAEIQMDINLNPALAMFTHNQTARGTGTDDGPTMEFIKRALDEYHKRGGTVPTHIGGPAQAILEILKGNPQERA